MIGMGTIIDNHPLFGEAMNEKELACAGLNRFSISKVYEVATNTIYHGEDYPSKVILPIQNS